MVKKMRLEVYLAEIALRIIMHKLLAQRYIQQNLTVCVNFRHSMPFRANRVFGKFPASFPD